MLDGAEPSTPLENRSNGVNVRPLSARSVRVDRRLDHRDLVAAEQLELVRRRVGRVPFRVDQRQVRRLELPACATCAAPVLSTLPVALAKTYETCACQRLV